MFTLFLYIVVSKLTCRKPYDLDRMLHRGAAGAASDEIRDTSDERVLHSGVPAVVAQSCVKRLLSRLIGITPEYTRGDRIIAWCVFFYSLVFSFGCCFLAVAIWNAFSPWPIKRWGRYFVAVHFIVPAIVSAISTVWFGIGGVLGLRQLFRDLAARKEVNALDDGRVENGVSLADKATR